GRGDPGVEGATWRRAFKDFGWLLPIASSRDQNGRPTADPPRGARPRPTRVSPATYWRRRVIVLAVGIGLLTTISWAASGLLAARSTASQAAHPGGTRAEPSAPARVSVHGPPGRPSPSSRPTPASTPPPPPRRHPPPS